MPLPGPAQGQHWACPCPCPCPVPLAGPHCTFMRADVSAADRVRECQQSTGGRSALTWSSVFNTTAPGVPRALNNKSRPAKIALHQSASPVNDTRTAQCAILSRPAPVQSGGRVSLPRCFARSRPPGRPDAPKKAGNNARADIPTPVGNARHAVR